MGFLASHLAPEEQVEDISRWLSIVSDQISKKNIETVGINGGLVFL